MSVPSPYAQRSAQTTEPKEDCRDYLRTGRCKYGASCKYNHPPNVQSGGGMKAPLDPSEPLFPIRPGEPICQYYMKHGTCKFGQTCKFNHPQNPVGAGGMDGNALLVGTGRKNEGTHMDWNASQGISMLPQRPGEANCMYFLKNGRCKYGATCRYHHPLNYHDRRNDDGRRQQAQQQQQNSDVGPKIHYVTQLPPGYQQGHFVVADGTVAFISLDGSTPAHVIQVPPGAKDGTIIYATNENGSIRALNLTRDLQSSSSSTSIASSFETAGSNIDPHGSHGDQGISLWNRPRKTGSTNSLNAYNIPENNPSGIIMHGNRAYIQNDNGGQGLPRVVSTSSHASDGSAVYFDANSKGYNRPMQQQQQHQAQPGGNPGTQWRGRRSSSFDYSKPSASSLYSQEEEAQGIYPRSFEDDGIYHGHYREQRSPIMRSRPPPSTRPRRQSQQGREVDDGLSMMTSALLTMLDTPEEAAGESYEYDEHLNRRGSPSEAPTPPMRQQYSAGRPGDAAKNSDDRGHQQDLQFMPSAFYYDYGSGDNSSMRLMMPSQSSRPGSTYGSDDRGAHNFAQSNHEQSNWYPNWQDASDQGRSTQENSQSIRPSPDSPHASSNVGLYLP